MTDEEMKQHKLNYIYNYSYIPVNKRKHTPLRIDEDGTDRDEFITLCTIEKDINSFVANGDNLFIHSVQCGNGKTSWALRLMNTFFTNIVDTSGFRCRGLFINVPQFLLALKDNISVKSEYITDIKENVLKADLIIWDDIGTKSLTPYESENLIAMIDARMNLGKSNIFTSNLTNDELKVYIGDRLASRIKGCTYNIELHGKDKRGLK